MNSGTLISTSASSRVLADVTEQCKLGDFGGGEEMVGEHIESDHHPFRKWHSVDNSLNLLQFCPKIFVDVGHDGLVEIVLFTPVIIKASRYRFPPLWRSIGSWTRGSRIHRKPDVR